MPRILNTDTLDQATKDWASAFTLPTQWSKKNPGVAIHGQEWALQNLFNMHYKDEHEYMLAKFRKRLGSEVLEEFEAIWKTREKPRSDKVLAELLAEKMAIDPEGNHIPGKIGTNQISMRVIGKRVTRHGMKLAQWPLYYGEDEERAAGNVREAGKEGSGADPLPETTTFFDETVHRGDPSVLFALNTNVSIEMAQAALDAMLDLLDEGAADGMLEGRDGSQPVDPNAATTGNLLFSLDLGTPAFAGSTDLAPNASANANAIADDVSADATFTLTYVRGSSSNSFPTALNNHIDGEAGTSGADFNFNTVAIVSGATISMTDWDVAFPQGPTAT